MHVHPLYFPFQDAIFELVEKDKLEEFSNALPYLGNPIKIRDKDNTTENDEDQATVNKPNVNIEDQIRNGDGWTLMQLAVIKNLKWHVEELLEGELFKM